MTKRQNAGGVDYNGGASNKTPESAEEESGNQTWGGAPLTPAHSSSQSPRVWGEHGRHSDKPVVYAPSRFHGILIN